MTKKLKQHIRPLIARDRYEPHRAATQLELLFDLAIVIAIAAAAHGFAHEISAGHLGSGIVKFLMAFLAVWWPWNLFTWFATSFDNDDAIYRINVMVMMFGALFVAANLPIFFKEDTLTYTFVGYVIMRLAFAVLWLRVGMANVDYRITAARYALGQIVLQGVWALVIFILASGTPLFFAAYAIAILAELWLPWYAEQAANTPWHRHHVIERFGLLNIIVLGEVILGSANALQVEFEEGFEGALLSIAICAAAIAFSMWWLYFCEEEHLENIEVKRAFIWGYGHFFVFGAGAAVGAGLDAMVEAIAEQHGTVQVASLTVAIAIALYIVGLWIVRDRYALHQPHGAVLLFFATIIALSGFLPYPPIPATILLIICLIARLWSRRRFSTGS
ncbi:MAG: low temperature requirement protein A [Spirulina sp. SIO3F2]|nr:low temperature requirement protein A [Spirulina sp. SIO3F2]